MFHSTAAARVRARLGAPLGALSPLSFAVLLSALLGACAMPTHPDSSAPAPDPFNPATVQLLDDTSWALTGWQNADGTSRAVPHGPSDGSGEPVALTLSTADGVRRASGYAGCNRYTGTYDLKNGALSFGPLASTRMACASAGGALEPAYLDALAHIAKTGVQMRAPQQLFIVTDDGATLTFARRSP
ncbi:META domain-containing protein [Burkholderia guangdongensis]|uniref:META domain-containing protein n=1 Tax=Burkholderia guangdongensis TaxID=1792500 RepID=UPI0015CA6AAF|nr:META domain-containing protein [Burkholderia guangdongensis]